MSNSPNTPNASNSRKSNPRKRNDNGGAGASPAPEKLLQAARAQLAELTGMTAESVSSFEQTEDGWTLHIEVLELERVPDTMSLLASYQVELDSSGQLAGYRRVRRYERGRADTNRPSGP
jgi:hypothetical protein